MDKNQKKGSLYLLITAVIWGCAFVAQSAGMEFVGPFTYQASRIFLGALALFITIKISDAKKKKNNTYKKMTTSELKMLIKSGVICGIALFTASSLQQCGIIYTTVGKAGFITALYILFVPIIGIFLKKRMSFKKWICVAVAVVGLFFLCMTDSFSLSKGDTLVLFCSLAYAAHILLVDKFAPHVDGIKLSFVQFLTAGIISFIFMLILETPKLSDISSAWLSIAYSGILSCGVAYTLQIIGQKHTPPAIASLLMSLESVFAVIAGIILLSQIPTPREILGCALMFSAIIAAQKLPE